MNYQVNALYHNKARSWLEAEELDYSDREKLLIRSVCSFISHGTEKLVTTHELSEEAAIKMAIPYMKGSLSDTFTYGYSLVGKVVEGPAELMHKTVHVMHPHQELCVVEAKDVVVIPDQLDPTVASLTSNLETAVNAIWDAGLEMGDRVQIIGYGIIGALVSKLVARFPGVHLDLLETDPDRRTVALRHGYTVYAEQGSSKYDIIFNTSGGEGSLQSAIQGTRPEGKVIELSWYGSRQTSLHLGGDFHYGRKQIISSQVSQVPFRKQPRWNYASRKDLVLSLLVTMDFADLIASKIEFAETPSFYDRLRKNEVDDLSTIITY